MNPTIKLKFSLSANVALMFSEAAKAELLKALNESKRLTKEGRNPAWNSIHAIISDAHSDDDKIEIIVAEQFRFIVGQALEDLSTGDMLIRASRIAISQQHEPVPPPAGAIPVAPSAVH